MLLLPPQGLETGQREGIRVRPQAMLEAKDLPPNHLSMLLEQRVNQKLEEDRQRRALQQVRLRNGCSTAGMLQAWFGWRAVVVVCSFAVQSDARCHRACSS